MKKQLLLLALACCVQTATWAQQATHFFKPVTADKVVLPENTRRGAFPSKYEIFQLDYAGVKMALATAPMEFTHQSVEHKCPVSIPLGNGQFEDFYITEVAMLDPEAAAAFPEIHTYSGVSAKNPRRGVRLSVTVRGFRAMVMEPDYSVSFVEPYAWGQTEFYISYAGKDAPDNGLRHLRTGVKEDGKIWFGEPQELYTPQVEDRGVELDPVRLKVYRYCVGTTGEFAQDHGTTKQEVFGAVTEYTNFVSATFERDISMRLQLISASQNATFLDPLSDPYTGTMVTDWMEQNPDVLNFYCNVNSHDVGHVYARYLGGSAVGVAGSIGNGCSISKAAGCSAGNGAGDYGAFFLNVIGQEIGHQLGGGHTWNRCNGGGGRNGNVAFEPGSGSTIMSYAGACGNDNVQDDSDLYYHSGSIEEIKNFYTFGGVCGSYIETTNTPPTVTLPYQDNFSIPISTPFELNGSASDADGDAITYCWEEIDAGPEVPLGQPAGNAAIFRTRPPVSVSNRYFPRLNTVISNGSDITEQLPTYSRDLTFRLTARDNKLNGGGVAWADVAFKAYEGAGPFMVTSPNTSTTIWRVGEYTEVTWDVANTNGSVVNCQTVNIRLSTNSGQSYPITLASGVPNDGSQYVLVPDNVSATLRVRVDAADNVFYDISNSNFKIQLPAQPSLTVGLAVDGGTVCLPGNFTTDVFTAGVLGFSDPVNLEVTGDLPPGATASFSATTLQPGQSASLKVDMSNVTVEGQYTFNVRATSGAQEFIRPVTILLRRNDFTGFSLQSPVNGLTNAGLTHTLHWNKGLDADTYDVQFSDSPAFTNILAVKTGTTLDSFKINFLLEKGKAYFWRVRPNNECGAHEWSDPYFFSTIAEDCRIIESNDLPKNLSANGTPTLETKVTVNQGGIISDVNIKTMDGYHTFFKDLEAHLIGPSGTDVQLWKDKCGNFNGFFNFGLDDAAPGAFQCPPNNTGQFYRPVNPLTAFIGQNSTGEWTFRLKDNVAGSGGTLEAFRIELCATLTVMPPYLVNNNVMPLPSGTNRIITPDFLLVEDPDNTHAQLKYTVMSMPEHGYAYLDNYGILHPGDHFTQSNLDAGQVRFYDFGGASASDGFYFMVTDDHGGFFGAPKFVVQPLVGTLEPQDQAIDFMLFPNPAAEMVQLAFGQALTTDTQVQLYDLAGREMNAWTMAAGASSLSFRVKDLPKGLYLVSVQNESGKGLKKLVVK